MKKMITAISAVALATAAIADTVVWYDFDGLGDAGTAVSHGKTIQNKANPGTLDATVIAVHHGQVAKESDSAHMPESVIGYPSGQRVYDPVGGLFATSADGAIQFTAPIPDNTYDGNDGGALYIAETSGELSTDKFTLEITIRIDAEFASDGTYQTIAAKSVSGSSTDYAWEVAWYNHNLVFRAYNTSAANNDAVAWAWGNIADGEWHHIAIVVDSSANATYPVLPYLDYTAKNLARYSSISGTGPMTIGARYNVSDAKYTHPARGVAIGEFRWSNVALSASQFLKVRNVPTGPTISHVKFDDGTPNAAAEYGTLCNGAFWASNSDKSVKPTYSSDVPGVRVLDGEDGAVLSKHNDKSISFPGNSHYPACALWGRSVNPGVPANLFETYFVPMTADGVARMSGTIEFWMKPTPGRQVAWSSQPALLSDYRNSKSQNIWQFIFVNSSGQSADPVTKFNFYVTMCTNNTGDVVWKGLTVCSSDDVLDGKWHHVAAVFQPSGTNPGKTDVVTYVDHTERGKTSFDGVIDYRLGAYTLQMGMCYEGLIDEFRISDRALTPSQFLRAENAPGLSIFIR